MGRGGREGGRGSRNVRERECRFPSSLCVPLRVVDVDPSFPSSLFNCSIKL
jgi:hypothetical protein